MAINVVSWDAKQRIVTLNIEGQQAQADVPATVITEQDWIAFLASVVQPVVDSMIQAQAYDPNALVQLGDLSASLLTADESAAVQKLGIGNPPPPPQGT